MKKRIFHVVMLLGLAAVCTSLWPGPRESAAAPKKIEPALKEFMRNKLSASNEILEGLVTEDFELIAKGAKKLTEISAAAKWRISNDAMYRQHTAEFQRIAKQLEKSAGEEKLEATALTWIEATMSCIECHKHVRSMLIAADAANGGAATPGDSSP